MSDCRYGVSPVNYPDPDPDRKSTGWEEGERGGGQGGVGGGGRMGGHVRSGEFDCSPFKQIMKFWAGYI